MTENIDPNDIEDCQKQVFDLEAEVRELRAALEAAKSQREAYKLSVYELREQLLHSVSEDALVSAQDDLAGCRAALERERMELVSASVSVSRARELTLAQEIRANNLSAALERARALLAEQAEIITANVWHIPPEYSARNIVLDAAAKMRDLAALLAAAPGGAELDAALSDLTMRPRTGAGGGDAE